MSDDLPPAPVVKDVAVREPRDRGGVPGDVPRLEPQVSPTGRKPHRRKISNYLLDKKLQLRYVLVVSILSAIIAGSLGWLIYEQEHRASEDLVAGLADLTEKDESLAEFQREVARDMRARDQALMLKMAGLGVGLMVILFVYLVLMTHKVAGPLYKVSHYFDQMKEGRLGRITALRRGDMLMDFFASFREMHETVRQRLSRDAAAMQRLVDACRAAGVEPGSALGQEVERLAKHVNDRQRALS